jgi:hypothetical protein
MDIQTYSITIDWLNVKLSIIVYCTLSLLLQPTMSECRYRKIRRRKWQGFRFLL